MSRSLNGLLEVLTIELRLQNAVWTDQELTEGNLEMAPDSRDEKNASCRLRFAVMLAWFATAAALNAQQTLAVKINWGQTAVISRSTPTLQVVVNPPLRPGRPLGAASFKALKDLGADYVRYVPWLPYPKLAVAELEPPTPAKTSWDFSLIDPLTKRFLDATDGHPTVMNFSTIPAWMFKTAKPVAYPADPDRVVWDYTQGSELRDPTGKQLGEYYNRLVNWYVNGGFTDENGVRHESGYHYKFPIWEVLNEPEFEHSTTPEQYAQRYDAIVEGIHRASPETKFMALALATPSLEPDYFEYFLDSKHHEAGIPIDYISYHFYAAPKRGENIDTWQYTFFDQENGFVNSVRYIERIRKRLSPSAKTDIDELGVILPTDNKPHDDIAPPDLYWNLAGALYADLFVQLSKLQIDIIGESQLVGYPTQFPSVSMMDWRTNKPNARYWVLHLIKDNFHPGDALVETKVSGAQASDITAQAFATSAGHKLLLINKRNHAIEISLPGASAAKILTVDVATGDGSARSIQAAEDKVRLQPFAVTEVSW